jgi:hypothetical protein
MGSPVIDPLERLQEWYHSHCNGCWEHQYGVSIETLDNPGWRFKVGLEDTELFGRPFDEVGFEGQEKNDWYRCWVKNHTFEAACGPKQLGHVIVIFLDWAMEAAKDAG